MLQVFGPAGTRRLIRGVPGEGETFQLDSFTRMLAAHVTMRCRRLKTVLLLWLEARDVGSPVGEICPVQIGDELGCHPDRVVDIVHCSGRVVPPPRNSVPAELWVPSKAILRQEIGRAS